MILPYNISSDYIRLSDKINWDILLDELHENLKEPFYNSRLKLGCFIYSFREDKNVDSVIKEWEANYALQSFTGYSYKLDDFPISSKELEDAFDLMQGNDYFMDVLEDELKFVQMSATAAPEPEFDLPSEIMVTKEEKAFLTPSDDRAEIDRKYNPYY